MTPVLPNSGERLKGFCPMGCGETLFVGSGGHITCSYLECKNPTAVDDILGDGETEHIVTLEGERFHIEHPLRERLDDGLQRCGCEHPETVERDDDTMLVYCTHCHKRHAVDPLETPCSPGVWIGHRIPTEPLQDGEEREPYSANLDREQALSAYSQQTGSEEIPASAIEPAEAFRAGWDACSARHPHQDVECRLTNYRAFGLPCAELGPGLHDFIAVADIAAALAPSPDDRGGER